MKKSVWLLLAAPGAILLTCAGLHSFLKASPGPRHVRFLHLADMHGQLDTHWEYLPEDPQRLHRRGCPLVRRK